jgi:choline dehydrogenase-like flavoprotein
MSTRLDPAPNADSRVTLASERDAFGVPRARLDWRLSDIDRHSAERALEALGQEVGRTGIGRLQIRFEPNAPWPEDLEGGYHHMGTTRMSADPRKGVVDADCRVHGLDNLYIAGSSVFTTGGSATPTMTLIALALRLADHLRERFE